MKSAAFNMAFKVHRNEIPFAEGLLKAVEVDAQEDFLEALNSLAGETKYDVMQMDQLILQARKSSVQEDTPKIDTSALKKEIRSLQKKKNEFLESIQTLETQKAALKPTIIPGVNAALLGLVGLMISFVIWMMGHLLGFFAALCITLVVSGLLVLQDIFELNKQRERIDRRKKIIDGDIKNLNEAIGTTEENLQKVQRELDSAQETNSQDEPFNPPPNSVLMP